MTNFTATFNDKLSRLALDMIHANPKLWNQREYHSEKVDSNCGTAHCFIGWCDVLLGNWNGKDLGISQQTRDSLGLDSNDYYEFIYENNPLSRLEALHLYHITGIFGIEGYDTDGFDRSGHDRNNQYVPRSARRYYNP